MLLSQNKQSKIAVINDISGYGRCSVTVALPILSAMRIMCCPIPTAILSNHTEYPHYYFQDYTPYMMDYIQHWKELSLKFDGVATGFLGSIEQIDIALEFLDNFKPKMILVDPVMGDHGKLYNTYSPAMCAAMRRLVARASIITPNLTEACLLTDTPYHPDSFTYVDYLELGDKLHTLGPDTIIITGIQSPCYIGNYIYQESKQQMIRTRSVEPNRPGTGDVFSSIIAGNMLQGTDIVSAVRQASSFIQKCLKKSEEYNIPLMDGVCFEDYLKLLIPKH